MKIYNTLTRKKEEFNPITPGEVKIYACGPTVYNYIHIGNARPLCVFDVLRRYLEYKDYKVLFMQNFTDIDDKIIDKATRLNVDYTEVAEKYIAEYYVDAKGLNLKQPTYSPKPTQNMDNIIKIVSSLEQNGYAYEINGDVYFRVKKYNDYGNLSHINMEDLEKGSRVDINQQKEDPLDFTLWKSAKPGEPYWDSPWGKGRPGWHIECSAMINGIFGDTIDIHCGGKDLIFPHHENEIAQSVCYTGKPLANYWMHNGYINVDNEKMSKSLGNFFIVREVAEKFEYPAIRFMMLQVHYRSPINYSYDIMEQSTLSLSRIMNCKTNIGFAIDNIPIKDCSITYEDNKRLDQYKSDFINAMDDDLNTADAISAIFELITDINRNIVNVPYISKGYIDLASKIFYELTDVLGILKEEKEEIQEEIKQLVELRQKARQEKNFKRADEIRDKIYSKGFILEDTISGVKISKKPK